VRLLGRPCNCALAATRQTAFLRRGVAQASRAAARYLADSRDSQTALARRQKPDAAHPEVNPFVVTSYNYGVGGLARALRQFGPDFVQVLERYRGRCVRVAVKIFVASFLAARHVALNAHAYF